MNKQKEIKSPKYKMNTQPAQAPSTIVGENPLNARAQALKNLHIANANFEKNYAGEKADDAANNLLNAVREYQKACKE